MVTCLQSAEHNMACNTDNKFIINQGMDNEFILTIKGTGTTSAMEIGAGDTFETSLYELESNTIIQTVNTTVEDAQSGKIKLTITEAEANALSLERGSKADRYYLKPLYRITIDCDTLNNGKFVAKLPEVYVE
jgi:hypothetical protein